MKVKLAYHPILNYTRLSNHNHGDIMAVEHFNAYRVFEEKDGTFQGRIVQQRIDDLPEGDVLIRVLYSSLNYKDALSARGNKGITRHYPHTPGIDAAGVVEDSKATAFPLGTEVIVMGNDLGMNTPGGFGGYIRVPASWVIPLPPTMTMAEAMSYGTAGFTAALCTKAIICASIKPPQKVVIAGATGGVGLIATMMLSKLGFHVVAATRTPTEASVLNQIGADEVIDTTLLTTHPAHPLLPRQWQAAIDTLGGPVTPFLVSSLDYRGICVSVGNVLGVTMENLSYFPFILRGVQLHGITAANCPIDTRREVFEQLGGDWNVSQAIAPFIHPITLEDIDHRIEMMLAGKHKGRSVIVHEQL